MRKIIKYPAELALSDKVNILSSLQKISLSDNESAVLAEIIELSSGNIVALSVHITKQIRNKLSISASLFNTSLHRLEQKGTMKKEGKTIILNPLYNQLTVVTEILIKLS